MRLVIAKYQEDISWAKSFNHIIYDKSAMGVNTENTIFLPNIGREAHTYLYHIVNNYNDLNDIEIFTQGNPFDHVPDFLAKIHNIQVDGYISLSPITKEMNFGQQSGLDYTELTGHYSKRTFKGPKSLWNYCFNRNVTQPIIVYCHAIFAVTKDNILQHPLSLYQKLLDLFGPSFPGQPREYGSLAYELESFWTLLFDKKYHD